MRARKGWVGGEGLGKREGDGVTGAARRQTVAKVERREGRGTHANFRLESGDPPPSLPSLPFHASSQGSTTSFVIHEAVTAQQSQPQSQHAAFHIRRSPVSRHLRL